MRRQTAFLPVAIAIGIAAVAACSSSSSLDSESADASTFVNEDDAASSDSAIDEASAASDGGAEVVIDAGPDGGCFVATVGVYGMCMTTSDCAALGDHTSTAGFCPGAADIECCSRSPNLADNPAVPVGWKLVTVVSADMTTWAVAILHDPTMYPMFSTTTKSFGALLVLARVEWHPPDFQNAVIHRGVTLYEPTD
jgi:hypothetical protein